MTHNELEFRHEVELMRAILGDDAVIEALIATISDAVNTMAIMQVTMDNIKNGGKK